MSAFATDKAGYNRRHPDAGSTRRWARSNGLAAAVGIAYFLAARLSLLLSSLQPDGVAVFWPASGVATGVLTLRFWTACALVGRRWRGGRDDCCQFHG